MSCNPVGSKKPHAVCIPYPAQGHINPIFKLAKLLHLKGFHVTFVNTEYNHKRLLKSRGPDSPEGLPDFRFEAIPDGLPPTDADVDATQDIPAISDSTSKTCLAPFRSLLSRLNDSDDVPPVTCIVSDGAMSFTLEAAQELGIPEFLFWTPSACGVLAYTQYHLLVERGLTPLKDASYLTNGYLETTIDWIPGMNYIRLRDLPSFIRTTDPNDIMLSYIQGEIAKVPKASALILNTFDPFEREALDALSDMFAPLFISIIGPLGMLVDEHFKDDKSLNCIGSNLWKEQSECLEWLDTKEPNSVVYVNFGSIATMTPFQLTEFAWGLANSNRPFLWVIRPDLVADDSTILPPEFVSQTIDRGLLTGWCPQEEVLKHPSIGGFLSHMGWNSTLESVSSGVPMLCWPFFADQQTNCFYACSKWSIGMEINSDVQRDEVEKLVLELMEGERGKEMRRKALEWKTKAEEATKPGGSSYQNFENLLGKILSANN